MAHLPWPSRLCSPLRSIFPERACGAGRGQAPPLHRVCAVVVLGLGAAAAQAATSLVSLDTFANFETAGVVVVVSGDPELNAAVALEVRRVGGPAYAPAHPLVRIDPTRFVGSLFWLDPATAYDVRVTLSDPNGTTGATTLTAAVTTRTDSPVEPSLDTLYVSTSGSDANDGKTPGTALRTIQEAADRSQPGDLILIAPGVYREGVVVPTSGTEAQPIVFRGSGPGAILDGADQAISQGASWTAEGSGVYSLTTGFATGHAVSDQGRLFRYGSSAELQSLAAGPPGGFFFDGTKLFIKFSDASAPAARTLHVARHEEGFVIDTKSWVRIENLEIRHYGSGDYGKGVYLRYASDCAVRESRLHEVGRAGVWIKGGSRNRIEDNELWDTSIFGWDWDETKGSSSENTAIVFTNDVGRGNVIRRNTVSGFFNGIAPCGESAPPSGFTNETDVYDNELFEHTDDAFEPEGYCSNLRIFRNRIRDSHMAFAVAPAEIGPTFIVRNTVDGIGNTRTSLLDGYTASALKINSGYPDAIGPLFLYHNTFFTDVPATNAVTLMTPGISTLITGRNNALVGTRYVLEKSNTVPLDWNGDLLYTTDPARFVKWHGTGHLTLSALQGATGQEFAGVAAVPGFTDAASGDFSPATDSALRDAGLLIPGINDGFEGSGPDIGAIEGTDVIFADGFESGDTSAWQ